MSVRWLCLLMVFVAASTSKQKTFRILSPRSGECVTAVPVWNQTFHETVIYIEVHRNYAPQVQYYQVTPAGYYSIMGRIKLEPNQLVVPLRVPTPNGLWHFYVNLYGDNMQVPIAESRISEVYVNNASPSLSCHFKQRSPCVHHPNDLRVLCKAELPCNLKVPTVGWRARLYSNNTVAVYLNGTLAVADTRLPTPSGIIIHVKHELMSEGWQSLELELFDLSSNHSLLKEPYQNSFFVVTEKRTVNVSAKSLSPSEEECYFQTSFALHQAEYFLAAESWGQWAFCSECEGQVYIDIGANVGQMADAVLKTCKDAAFSLTLVEALKVNVDLLHEKYGHDPRIHVVHVGMTDKVGEGVLYNMRAGKTFVGEQTATLMGTAGDQKGFPIESVPLTTMDVWASEHFKDTKIDYLKIDTEGTEPMIVMGTMELLARGQIDFLQFECPPRPMTNITLEQLANGLDERGYDAFFMGKSEELLLFTPPFYDPIYETTLDFRNCIAIKRSLPDYPEILKDFSPPEMDYSLIRQLSL